MIPLLAYAGHLTEKTLTLDYKKLDAIVICSGDGLVYEVSGQFLSTQPILESQILGHLHRIILRDISTHETACLFID